MLCFCFQSNTQPDLEVKGNQILELASLCFSAVLGAALLSI